MKKLFNFLFATAIAISSFAESKTVIFNFENENYTLQRDPVETSTGSNDYFISDSTIVEFDGVAIMLNGDSVNSQTGWRLWSDGLRAFSKRNPSFTVSAYGNYITHVSLEVVSGATFTLKGEDENKLEWELYTDSATFIYTAESNKSIKTITVVYEDDENIPTGINNTTSSNKVKKMIKDGHLYIINNDKIYNIYGSCK